MNRQDKPEDKPWTSSRKTATSALSKVASVGVGSNMGSTKPGRVGWFWTQCWKVVRLCTKHSSRGRKGSPSHRKALPLLPDGADPVSFSSKGWVFWLVAPKFMQLCVHARACFGLYWCTLVAGETLVMLRSGPAAIRICSQLLGFPIAWKQS